jgi:hypothetical protein
VIQGFKAAVLCLVSVGWSLKETDGYTFHDNRPEGHALYVGWVMAFLKIRRVLDFKRFEKSARNQSNIVQLISGVQEIKLNNCEKKMLWRWETIQAELFEVPSVTVRYIRFRSIEHFHNIDEEKPADALPRILLAEISKVKSPRSCSRGAEKPRLFIQTKTPSVLMQNSRCFDLYFARLF